MLTIFSGFCSHAHHYCQEHDVTRAVTVNHSKLGDYFPVTLPMLSNFTDDKDRQNRELLTINVLEFNRKLNRKPV